jgi:hypothetical protein
MLYPNIPGPWLRDNDRSGVLVNDPVRPDYDNQGN